MAAHWVGTRIRIPMLRTSAAVLALGFLSAPVMAGEFRSGTYSDAGSSRTTRNVLSGVESLDSTRSFTNVVTGNSQVNTVSFSGSADNARLFGQGYAFATGDISAQGSAGGGGALSLEGDTVFTGDLPSFLGALFGQDVQGTIGTGIAGQGGGGATAQGSVDVDGRAGLGREIGLDGSLDFSFQEGSQDIAYGLNESGSTDYSMQQTYSETTVSDDSTASGGSVFSFN